MRGTIVERVPLRNRVQPDGEPIATPSRGSLMGNRGGQLHDPATRLLTRRRWVSKRWICCLLAFKNRRREVWGQSYTELFFLDEPTALAAGHRPCYECRRAEAAAFARALMRHEGLSSTPTADEIDVRLHAERLCGRRKRLHGLPFSALPPGAMVLRDDSFFLVDESELRLWTPTGYACATARPVGGVATVLTPPTALAALWGGYPAAQR